MPETIKISKICETRRVKTLYKKILFILLILGFFSIFTVIFTCGRVCSILIICANALLIAGVIYLLFSFSRKLKKINNQLQVASSGSFTTDFPEKIRDEFDLLSLNISHLFKDMKEYDSLRAKDVSKSVKAFSKLLANASEPLIVIDFEENSAVLNPPAQKIWKVESKEFSLDVVRKHAQNVDFNRFLKRVLVENLKSDTVGVYFPSSSKKEVTLKSIAVKTIDGRIPLVILFVQNGNGKNGKKETLSD